MTLIKRSFIYIRRNKKSNSILFVLFMFITTFVLLGCNIMEFTGHIAENLREKIGGIIYIYPNTVDMEEFEMMTKQAELKKQAYESTLKSRALSVLIYLIDRSNKELTCFPAIPTMAKHLHISISTVKRALHELENSGYIKKEARFRDKNKGQTSNLYMLVLFERCQMSDDGEHQEPKKSEEYGEVMEVATVEVPQENQSDRKQHRVEHISFDMIKAWKEENGGRPESEPPQVPNIKNVGA